MATPVQLYGKDGRAVSVNESGEVLIADGAYDLAVFNELAEPDTAYNFYNPCGLQQFVITGILMYADKQVSAVTNATIIVYESSAPDSTTVDRTLLQLELGQNQSLPFPNLRILCNPGVYINGKTDDDDVHMTLLGHFVDLDGKGETQG